MSQSVREMRSHGEISRVAAGWLEQKEAAEEGDQGLKEARRNQPGLVQLKGLLRGPGQPG